MCQWAPPTRGKGAMGVVSHGPTQVSDVRLHDGLWSLRLPNLPQPLEVVGGDAALRYLGLQSVTARQWTTVRKWSAMPCAQTVETAKHDFPVDQACWGLDSTTNSAACIEFLGGKEKGQAHP